MGRKSKSNRRKPEILENLYKVLSREGLEGTTLSKVAAEMGVNSGLLVHYFKTKEEMILAMVDYMLNKYADLYISTLNQHEDPHKRLDVFINTFFEPEWTQRGDASVFWSCFSLSFRNDRVRERFEFMYEGFRRLLADEINIYIKAGIVAVTDSLKTADIVISLIEGFNFYRSASGAAVNLDDTAGFFKRTVSELLMKRSQTV